MDLGRASEGTMESLLLRAPQFSGNHEACRYVTARRFQLAQYGGVGMALVSYCGTVAGRDAPDVWASSYTTSVLVSCGGAIN
jgi:hypothetical protein